MEPFNDLKDNLKCNIEWEMKFKKDELLKASNIDDSWQKFLVTISLAVIATALTADRAEILLLTNLLIFCILLRRLYWRRQIAKHSAYCIVFLENRKYNTNSEPFRSETLQFVTKELSLEDNGAGSNVSWDWLKRLKRLRRDFTIHTRDKKQRQDILFREAEGYEIAAILIVNILLIGVLSLPILCPSLRDPMTSSISLTAKMIQLSASKVVTSKTIVKAWIIIGLGIITLLANGWLIARMPTIHSHRKKYVEEFRSDEISEEYNKFVNNLQRGG